MTNVLSLSYALIALASTLDTEADKQDLAQKIKEGDHKAFRTFYDAHFDSLLRFLVSRNTSKEAAKDIIQKAFIYIWEHRSKIDPDKSLKSYIFRIAYTRMLNHHRDHKKFSNDEAVPEQESRLTPEDHARETDLKKAIDRAIEEMPEKRGMVFRLCFVEDLTYKEAAETMEVTPKTIENHMGLALKDIRKSLERFR
ncbi:RNA polymerase sigma-70 factor [Fodinibius halophilus]|uniref:RNA polymerase sigma-70 factor n=1 Tax=Fodinibius halophilus TaxID=1736908 RepID=A0A6M1SXW0_9BACT|nr:RNA polymerase sigma-70 factor [Fodinibius halophilus]NGP88738.1 RNA polymerase sigma-70 factor [Fodinibius halophilus]